jgi:hypothetical protein
MTVLWQLINVSLLIGLILLISILIKKINRKNHKER